MATTPRRPVCAWFDPVTPGGLDMVACFDGSVWSFNQREDGSWYWEEEPPIPGSARAKERAAAAKAAG